MIAINSLIATADRPLAIVPRMTGKVVNQVLGVRLAAARTAAKLSQPQLAEMVGMRQSAIAEIEGGRVKRPKKLREIARAVGRTEEWLLDEADVRARPLISSFDPDEPEPDPASDNAPLMERVLRRELGPGEIVERDARGGMGGGSHGTVVNVDGQPIDNVTATWTIPQSFLHTELRARENDVDMIPVDGDSMIPTLLPGDRVMIHRSVRNPSPDGIFAISDGIGISVKRLQLVRGSDPLQVRIMSDNPNHKEDIVAVSDLNVIGRVIMKVTRL